MTLGSEAASALIDLDAFLALDGQDIVLQRLSGTVVASEVTVRAFVRGFDANELTGSITQSDSRVICSPTQIIADGWPGPNSSSAYDTRVPRRGDKAVIAGRLRNVEAAVGIYVDDALVRIEMRVLG